MTDIPGEKETQLGFDLGGSRASTSYEPNLDEVREDLHHILDSARHMTADAPWDERTFRYNKVVFPQMARWLPEDEATQLRFEFWQEIERIERLLAA